MSIINGMIAVTDSIDFKNLYICNSRDITVYSENLLRTLRIDKGYMDEHLTHSIRVSILAREIGKAMGLNTLELNKLFISGLLHDIGKSKIPSRILNKPNRLSDSEYKIIQKHSIYSEQLILKYTNKNYPLDDIAKVVRHHHEDWDGSGYPDNLKSTEIPLLSRILSIADVFDAINNPRVYRKKPIENPIELLGSELSHKFDTLILEKYAIGILENFNHDSTHFSQKKYKKFR